MDKRPNTVRKARYQSVTARLGPEDRQLRADGIRASTGAVLVTPEEDDESPWAHLMHIRNRPLGGFGLLNASLGRVDALEICFPVGNERNHGNIVYRKGIRSGSGDQHCTCGMCQPFFAELAVEPVLVEPHLEDRFVPRHGGVSTVLGIDEAVSTFVRRHGPRRYFELALTPAKRVGPGAVGWTHGNPNSLLAWQPLPDAQSYTGCRTNGRTTSNELSSLVASSTRTFICDCRERSCASAAM